MQPALIIAKKKEGETLSAEELSAFLSGYMAGNVADYQMSAFLMAVYFQGMTPEEMAEWTKLMWHSGMTFGRSSDAFRLDKHSTGGVGDKTSLLLVPLVLAAAEKHLGKGKVVLPMVSGRGLGHTGGTLDKLESVSGFSCALSQDTADTLLKKNGFFMLGQTEAIAPADKRLYALRDVTATVDSIPLIVSSILSKKLAENLDGLVLDVKCGGGAFMKTAEEADLLAQTLAGVAKANGVSCVALVTSMDEPLGWTVGNQLEVKECWEFLNGKTETGLRQVTVSLAAQMLALASKGKLSISAAAKAVEEEIGSAHSQSIFKTMFTAQGGDWEAFLSEVSSVDQFTFLSPAEGWLAEVDALQVGNLLGQLGGGRRQASDLVDPQVGFVFLKKVGDPVKAGEGLVTVFYRSKTHPQTDITVQLRKAIRVSPRPVPPTQWLKETYAERN